MAKSAETPFVGNLSSDVELKEYGNTVVANFNLAHTPQHFDRNTQEWVDEDPVYLRASLWGQAARNAKATLKKGMQVIALGELKGNQYEVDGAQRYSIQYRVTTIGPALDFATAEVTKNPKKGNGGSNNSSGNSAPTNNDTDGWGDDGSSDDVPF